MLPFSIDTTVSSSLNTFLPVSPGSQPTIACRPRPRWVPGGVSLPAVVAPPLPAALDDGAAGDCGAELLDCGAALVGWFAGVLPPPLPPPHAARTGRAVAVTAQAAIRPGFIRDSP